eukprot:161216-Rhodomonas_salina.3
MVCTRGVRLGSCSAPTARTILLNGSAACSIPPSTSRFAFSSSEPRLPSACTSNGRVLTKYPTVVSNPMAESRLAYGKPTITSVALLSLPSRSP